MTLTLLRILAVPLLLGSIARPTAAQNGTEAGQFVVEHPTLHNLGFEWSIRGERIEAVAPLDAGFERALALFEAP